MKKNIYLRIVLETLPILFGVLLTYLFWQNAILLAILYIAAIALLLTIKYEPGDTHALIYGFIIGFLVETIGTSVSGYQSFTNPDILGIPIWLPIVWAYGLMLMKRIGVIIYESRSKGYGQ